MLASARARLQELRSKLDSAWASRRDSSDIWIGAMLVILSVIQMKDVVFDAMPGSTTSWQKGLTLIGLAALVSVLIVVFRRRGLRNQ